MYERLLTNVEYVKIDRVPIALGRCLDIVYVVNRRKRAAGSLHKRIGNLFPIGLEHVCRTALFETVTVRGEGAHLRRATEQH